MPSAAIQANYPTLRASCTFSDCRVVFLSLRLVCCCAQWVNIFKPGKGTITVFENSGGARGTQLYTLTGIPLTPGPLLVVVKVASSQVANTSGFWPPNRPDSIETISASCECAVATTCVAWPWLCYRVYTLMLLLCCAALLRCLQMFKTQTRLR